MPQTFENFDQSFIQEHYFQNLIIIEHSSGEWFLNECWEVNVLRSSFREYYGTKMENTNNIRIICNIKDTSP